MGSERESTACEDIDSVARELLAKFYGEILSVLKTEANETKRMLKLIAWLTRELEERSCGRLVIVGGFAVEVYTGMVYRTMDVDLIAEGYSGRVLEKILEELGERIARGYIIRYEELLLKSIDIVGSVYDKKLPPVKMLVDNWHVYLIPPEELIITYLCGWKYWRSVSDRDKALWVLIVFYEKLNRSYLWRRAREENVIDKLVELENIAQEAIGEKRE